ncbi:unnamed protein product, partial [Laminaria digitata]
SRSLHTLGPKNGSQGEYDEARPLHARAIAIGGKALGPEHPDLAV